MSEHLSNLLIGILFGASLDLAGFGSAKKLNAQFRLRDFSMFKVMFGAIIMAAWVYSLFLSLGAAPVAEGLIPGVTPALLLGAFLLGAGLVIGGYCPGTATAAMAAGRIDAILFFLMMYPGFRLWLWLEPRLGLNLYESLVDGPVTLPEFFAVQKIWILLGVTILFLAGWRIATWFEQRETNPSV